MAHSEPTYPQVLLDELGESKKPECVRNGGAVLAEPSRQLLLGPPEFGQEPLVGLCGLDWIQILSKEILDETELERLRVARLTHDRGHARQAGLLGRSPSALPHEDLILRPARSHDQGLEYPRGPDRGGELFERLGVEAPSGLLGVRDQTVDREFA